MLVSPGYIAQVSEFSVLVPSHAGVGSKTFASEILVHSYEHLSSNCAITVTQRSRRTNIYRREKRYIVY